MVNDARWVNKSLFKTIRLRSCVVVIAAASGLAACINTPLPDYYVLTSERSNPGVDLPKLPELAVGVGPITIPETVNRPNIVTPKDANQLEVAEYHRWSEPLRENISRVLITNLADRLGVNKLYAYPWLRAEIDNIVRLDVLQMTGSLGDSVYLQVRWQVLTGDKPYQLLETRISEYRHSTPGGGYSSLVAAYSAAYAALADDIALALAQLSGMAASSTESFLPKRFVAALESN